MIRGIVLRVRDPGIQLGPAIRDQAAGHVQPGRMIVSLRLQCTGSQGNPFLLVERGNVASLITLSPPSVAAQSVPSGSS